MRASTRFGLAKLKSGPPPWWWVTPSRFVLAPFKMDKPRGGPMALPPGGCVFSRAQNGLPAWWYRPHQGDPGRARLLGAGVHPADELGDCLVGEHIEEPIGA
eukprot:scaffold32824_cov112-Isochrysis_galbana.AAC.1